MDTLDLAILRSILHRGPTTALDLGYRPSFASIARELFVDESTVKHRFDRLARSGFVRGWSIALNPQLVGQRAAQMWVDVESPSAKPEAIAQLRLLPGMAVVKDLYGPAIGLMVYYESEAGLRRLDELVRRIAHAGASTVMPEPYPPCATAISPADIELLGAVQSKPFTSYARLAERLGRSPRTVQRRLERLSESGAIYLVAELDPKALVGGIVGSLLVTYAAGPGMARARTQVRELVADRMLFAELDAPEHDYFAMILNGIAQSRDRLASIRGLDGVRVARLDLVAEVFSQFGVFREQLDGLSRRTQRPATG